MPSSFVVTHEGGYSLRLVGPGLGGSATTVLATAMQARWLTPAGMRIPVTEQWSDGQWTARLNDSGEGTITFPNTPVWRSQLADTEAGRLYWLEIWGPSDRLEFVFVIDKVTRGHNSPIVVEGFTGSFALKSAYESDYLCVMAPRDVIERYTTLPVPLVADDLTSGSLDGSKWTTLGSGPGTRSVTMTSRGAQVAVSTTGAQGLTDQHVRAVPPITSVPGRWRFTATVTIDSYTAPGSGYAALQISDATGFRLVSLAITVDPTDYLDFISGWTDRRPGTIARGGPRALVLESDGRWIRGYIDGTLVGIIPSSAVSGTAYPDLVVVGGTGGACTAIFSHVAFREQRQFLLRGSDKGDYVLPGTAATYPTGGLHGRYYSDLDLPGSGRLKLLFSPTRTSYADRQDATINNPVSPKPGAADTSWSARFFGAVYLKAGGAYTFTLSNVIGASRLWVGKTAFGDEIISDWAAFAGAHTVTGSYTPAKEGWYPIVLEYAHDTGTAGIVLAFTPPNIGNYTDPGGTTITANGSTSTTIPATSLSPLGCVDQRYQGVSHFQILQDAGKAFGYQWRDDPRSLESGEFPCQLIPRVRVGRDTDEIVEPDEDDRRSPAQNLQSVVDATDQASSIRGQGAGSPDGKLQVVAEVLDIATMNASLFDLEAWADATDIAFPALLRARLITELGLRRDPWMNIAGDPLARDRLADSYPLTGVLAAMLWQPGDGARVQDLLIDVVDATPRQILQFTRQFTPEGRTGAAAGFRNRPKSEAAALRQLVFAALRPQRTYQPQRQPLVGNYATQTLAAGVTGNSSVVALLPQDQVVSAVVRVVQNSAGVAWGLLVNGTDQTSNLGGPWAGVPAEVDVTAYVVTRSGGVSNVIAAVKNLDGVTTSTFDWQLVVTVAR